MASIIPPPLNETEHSVSRLTREGKKITYTLRVKQQPERARACGAGAKSSADRRPVDPPPVVQMFIFESEPHDDTHKTDITFAYNANFFLFATLETARPLAQGRLAPTPSCPVLTGVPVAGVAYLDRPEQAGYFIFPDLSVRHEGVYRLSFHLFEQTKDPKNATQGTQPLPPPVPGKLSAPQQFLDFRLEVLSTPFTVFSAKKFPGLTTSTRLSCDIADQGCRVRIRRDVRMRRRGGDKRPEDFEREGERAYSRRHPDGYATPDAYSANAPERPRSKSISSVDHAYAYPSQRRPSGPEYGSQNQQYQRPMPPTPGQSSTPIPPPIRAPTPVAVSSSTPSPASAYTPAPLSASATAPPPLHTPSYQSHLLFGSTQTQYPAPPLSYGPHPVTTPTTMYSPRPSISHGRNSSTGTEYEASSAGYPFSHPRLPTERPNYPKPPTTPLPPLRLPNSLSMQVGEGHHSHEPIGIARSQTPSSNMVTSLPPLKSLSEFPPTSFQPSSISSPGIEYGPGRALWETNQSFSKRTYEETFGHDDRPLHNGMRPDGDHHGGMRRRPSNPSEFDSDPMTYKRANGEMTSRIRAMSSASVLRPPDRSVDIDCSVPDHQHQLQRSLELICGPPDSHSACYSSRKQAWNASRTSLESDYLSEVSGQFDDAEEFGSPLPGHKGITTAGDANYSPSSHSVKRQRSNDWPRHSADNVSAGRREHASGSTRQRWPFHHYGRQSHGSPRSPRHGRSGRRSRFVEGHMNDTVSEKPPSIFFRDEARNETARSGSRQSGIFRFGRAIASAFNPFGGWVSVSEIWKGSHDGNRPQEVTNDRLRQAELAYEELKRSGYQGTAKGSCMQSLGTMDASLPEETWRSIQAKMDNDGGGGQHSRQSSGHTPSNYESVNYESVSGSSLRPSFPDLRKAKSSLGIPRGQEVRHQKSRKDMQRQAKLLKRVSDLEDKLLRARRELREISGEEELLTRSLNDESPYQRRFVPGALPSLPSETLLHDPEPTPLSPLREATQAPASKTEARIQVPKTRLLSPKPSAQSPSRKRKSPDPESRQPDRNDIHQQPPPDIYIQEDQATEPAKPTQTPTKTEPDRDPEVTKSQPKTTPSRKVKLPKTARGDSPGSVERKQKQKRSPAAENSTSPVNEDRASRPLWSTTRNRSATPVLRMKRGRGDLRSTASLGQGDDLGSDENKENHTEQKNEPSDHSGLEKTENEQDTQQQQGESDQTPNPAPRRKARYEYIPPVPPLPKDLAATAAKVDRRLAREMGGERFQWPEDIF
ncbi:velvet factor-domain-containing protein [Aspergillus spectabilis]